MVLTTTGTAAVQLTDSGCVNSSKPDCAPEKSKVLTTASIGLLRESETSVAAVAIQEQQQEQKVVTVPQLPAERAIGSFRHALRTGKVSIYSLPSVLLGADCNVALCVEKACTCRLSSAWHTVKAYPVTWYTIVNAYPVTWYFLPCTTVIVTTATTTVISCYC